MGEVYKAEDAKLSRAVALKFLPPGQFSGEAEKARFLREARAAAALDHPNICTVYEVDEVDGQPFIAMAYLEGETVQSKIESSPLAVIEAIGLAIQTARGLAAAHEKGVVHRDIKSANLMVTQPGPDTERLIKIMDFGLAKLAAGTTKLTQEGTMLGTAAYMSPEQGRGEDVDHRTDLWSLGVVLHEMVSGRLPFRGEYTQSLVYAIIHEKPDPLTALRTGVPMELERIVQKALAKDREDRYQSASDFAADLRVLRKTLDPAASGATGPQIAKPGIPVGAKGAVPGGEPARSPTGGAVSDERPPIDKAVDELHSSDPLGRSPSSREAPVSSHDAAAARSDATANGVGRLRRKITLLMVALAVAVGVIAGMWLQRAADDPGAMDPRLPPGIQGRPFGPEFGPLGPRGPGMMPPEGEASDVRLTPPLLPDAEGTPHDAPGEVPRREETSELTFELDTGEPPAKPSTGSPPVEQPAATLSPAPDFRPPQPPSVTGEWEAVVPTRTGPQRIVLKLQQEGGELSGTISSPRGEMKIVDGRVEGGRFSFRAGGPRGRETVTYRGRFRGRDLILTMPSHPRRPIIARRVR